MRASATLDQTETYSLAGTWQIAFLGEAKPRAARPGRDVPASCGSRPPKAQAVNKGPSESPGALGPSRYVAARSRQNAPVDSAESRRGLLRRRWACQAETSIREVVGDSKEVGR